MSTNENTVSQTNAAAAAQEPAVTPEMIVEQLRAMRQHIPDYVHLPIAEARTIQTIANVHPQFAQAAINAIGASPTVQESVGRTPEELQQEAETSARWSKVEDELLAMLKGVVAANLTRRHRLGQAALVAYSVSKGLVRSRTHAALIPHVSLMRKTNRLGRSRKPAPQPQTPVPIPIAPA